MKKHIFTFLSLLPSLLAAQSVGEYFAKLDDEYFFWTFDKTQRQNLIENYKKSGEDSISTHLEQFARLEVYDENGQYLRVRTSKVGTFEMKILPTESGPLVCASVTACAPICDSYLMFFDQNLNLMTGETLPMLPATSVPAEFFDLNKIHEKCAEEMKDNPSAKKKKAKKMMAEITEKVIEFEKELEKKMDIVFKQCSFSPDNANLTVEAYFENYLPEDVYKQIKPYLAGNCVEFVWKNGHYKTSRVYWKN